MIDITQAQAIIAALAAELRDAIRDRGYDQASSSVQISADGSVQIRLTSGGPEIFKSYGSPDSHSYSYGDSIPAAAEKARQAIATIRDIYADDPWVLMGKTAVQEAAE